MTKSAFLGLALASALAVGTAAPVQAHVSTAYAIIGIEVWATPTVGTFVGDAVGAKGDIAVWRASIEHTVETQPSGEITGGRATVRTSDLTRVTGEFAGGKLVLMDDGEGDCGQLKHRVRGKLVNVTRSDANAVGTGLLRGTLIHYRASVLGFCIAYSATAEGTITFTF